MRQRRRGGEKRVSSETLRPAASRATCGRPRGGRRPTAYAEFEARANRLAHFLEAQGLERLDHCAILENNPYCRKPAPLAGAAGLYYTCINAYQPEAANSPTFSQEFESQVLITSREKLAVAQEALADCPGIKTVLVVDSADVLPDETRYKDYERALAAFPEAPLAEEWLGTSMLYSSGTTGRPKGIIRPLPAQAPTTNLALLLS